MIGEEREKKEETTKENYLWFPQLLKAQTGN